MGVNYNVIVKILYRNFSEKKAAAYLFKLEQQTAQMVAICKEIMALSQQLEQHITEKTRKMVAKIHRGSNLLEVWTTKR